MSETLWVVKDIVALFEGEYDWDNGQRTDCPYLVGTRLHGFYMKGFRAARSGHPYHFGKEGASNAC